MLVRHLLLVRRTIGVRDVSDAVRERGVLGSLVEAAQLDHVVHQADHGKGLGPLLLQLLQVVAQVVHHSLVMLKTGVVAVAYKDLGGEGL